MARDHAWNYESCVQTMTPTPSPGSVEDAWTTACMFDMDGTIRGSLTQQTKSKGGANCCTDPAKCSAHYLCESCGNPEGCKTAYQYNGCGSSQSSIWASDSAAIIKNCWENKRHIGCISFVSFDRRWKAERNIDGYYHRFSLFSHF